MVKQRICTYLEPCRRCFLLVGGEHQRSQRIRNRTYRKYINGINLQSWPLQDGPTRGYISSSLCRCNLHTANTYLFTQWTRPSYHHLRSVVYMFPQQGPWSLGHWIPMIHLMIFMIYACYTMLYLYDFWLVVSSHSKNISQIGSSSPTEWENKSHVPVTTNQ